jgi:early endosome antigen 1
LETQIEGILDDGRNAKIEWEAENQRLQNEVDDYIAKINQLNQDMELERAFMESKLKAIESLKRIVKHDKTFEVDDDEASEQVSEMDSASLAPTDLSKSVEMLYTSVARSNTMKIKLKKVVEQKDQMTDKVVDLESELENCLKDLDDARRQIESSNQIHMRESTERATLARKIADLENELAEAARERRSSVISTGGDETKKDEKGGLFKGLKVPKIGRKRQGSEGAATLSRFVDQKASDDRIRQLVLENEKLRSDLQIYASQQASSFTEFSQLTTQLKATERALENEKALGRDKLKEANTRLKAILANHKELEEYLQSQVQELTDRLMEPRDIPQDIHDQIANLKTELLACEKAKIEAEQTISKLEREIVNLQQHLQNARIDIQHNDTSMSTISSARRETLTAESGEDSQDIRLTNAKEQISGLQSRIAQVTAELDRTRYQLSLIQTQKEQAEARAADYEKGLSEFKQQAEELQARNLKLMSDVAHAQNQMAKAQSSKAEADERVSLCEKQLAAAQQQVETLQGRIKQLTQDADDGLPLAIKDDIAKLKEDFAKSQKENTEAAKRVSELEQQLSSSIKQFDSLQKEMSKAQEVTANDDGISEIDAAKAKVAGLQARLALVAAERERLKFQLLVSQTMKEKVEKKSSGIDEDLMAATQEIEEYQSRISKLTSEIADVQIQLTWAQSSKAEAEGQVKDLQSQLSKANEQVDALQIRVAHLEQQIQDQLPTDVKDKLKDLEADLASLQNSKDQAEKQSKNLEKELHNVGEQLNKLQSTPRPEPSELEKQIEKSMGEVVSLQSRLAQVTAELERKKFHLAKVESSMKEPTDQISRNAFETQLAEATNEIKVLQNQIHLLTTELSELRKAHATSSTFTAEEAISLSKNNDSKETLKDVSDAVQKLSSLVVDVCHSAKNRASLVADENIFVLETADQQTCDHEMITAAHIEDVRGQIMAVYKNIQSYQQFSARLDEKLNLLLQENLQLKLSRMESDSSTKELTEELENVRNLSKEIDSCHTEQIRMLEEKIKELTDNQVKLRL